MSVEVGSSSFARRAKRVAQMVPRSTVLRAVGRRAAVGRWQETALLVIALCAILAIRDSLVGWASMDYSQFLDPWFTFLQTHGFAGLGQEFANYNVPYLYLLWIGTLTPASALSWVKLLSSLSDLAMAAGAFVLIRQLRMPRFVAAASAVLLLLLPEVLFNSALWGQADSVYTAFIVWSLSFAVRQRPTATWILFALALAFKLQALFVLPALALAFVVHRHRIRALLVAVLVFFATYIPAIVAGRSIPSLLAVYSNQAGQYRDLTMNAPTLYAWLPQASFDTFQRSGTLFAVAVTAVLLAVLIRRFRSSELTPEALLLVAALFATIVPFMLPAMHERYFYAGDVLIFLLAVQRRRFIVAALVAQVVAIQAYTFFLFRVDPLLPVPLLTLVQLGVILGLAWPLLVPERAAAAAGPAAAVDPVGAPTPSTLVLDTPQRIAAL